MKATITSVNPRSYKERPISGAKLFISSDENCPDSVIDKWFSDNEIYLLNFKCKTWSKVKGLSTRKMKGPLKELVKCFKMNYSHKCGCSCGCSPGYNVTDPLNKEHVNTNIYVKCEGVPNDADELRDLLELKYLPMLKDEIKSHQND